MSEITHVQIKNYKIDMLAECAYSVIAYIAFDCDSG